MMLAIDYNDLKEKYSEKVEHYLLSLHLQPLCYTLLFRDLLTIYNDCVKNTQPHEIRTCFALT